MTLSSQKRCFRYHIRIPCAGFYDNGVPATNGTRPNRFAAVIAGPNIFRRMSRPDVGRVWIGPIRLFRCTRVPGNFTNFARSARNRPRALSQTGIPTRHDQLACRKARERSRVVVEPGQRKKAMAVKNAKVLEVDYLRRFRRFLPKK